MDLFPELYTKRLKLRKIQIEDVPSLIQYANNQKISDHIINIPYPYREPDAVFRISYVYQGFKNKTRYVFAITLKESGELIGEISLHLEPAHNQAQLGYWVGEPFWNQGIASEAAAEVLKFGFGRLDLSKIYATWHLENGASGKVLINNGMIQDNVNGHVALCSLSKQEYEQISHVRNEKKRP